MFLLKFRDRCSPADFTISSSSSILSKMDISIFFSKFVSIFAICLSRIYSGISISRQTMFSCGNCLKMFWVNTPSVIANMMNMKSVWYIPLIINIRKSMGIPFSVVRSKSTISRGIMNFSRPSPTFIFKFFNMCKKCFFSIKTWSTHKTSYWLSRIDRHYITIGTFEQGV